MVYRYQLSKNPRSLLFPVTAVVLVGGSIALGLGFDRTIGIVALIVSALIGYYLVKLFRTSLASVVHLNDDGISAVSPMGASYSLAWSQITLAGVYEIPGRSVELFVYAEGTDNLFRIPDTYHRFDEMRDELGRFCGSLVRFSGPDPDTLVTQIRERLSV